MNRIARWCVLLAAVFAAAFYVSRPGEGVSPASTGGAKSPGLEAKSKHHSGELLKLYEGARQEGVVDILAANPADIEWISESFGKEYPGVAVRLHVDANAINKVEADLSEGKVTADVVWSSEALVRPLIDAGALVFPEWSRFGLGDGVAAARGAMAVTNSSAYAIAYRSDMVDPSDVPRRWEELTDPKYRGKMVASRQLFVYLMAGLGAIEGEQRWANFAKEFAGMSETLWTARQHRDILASGRKAYVVGTAYYLPDQWKMAGAPIDFVLPEPILVTQFGSVILRNAPHPNAARLLAVWLAGAEGRAARERATLAVDLRATSDHPLAKQIRSRGAQVYDDTEAYMDARGRLASRMALILSLAEGAP